MSYQFNAYQQGYQAQSPTFESFLLDEALEAMQKGFSAQDLYWIERHAREGTSSALRQVIDQKRLELEEQAQAARVAFQQAQSDLQREKLDADKQNLLTQRWLQWMTLKGNLLALQEKAILAREDMDKRHVIAWQQVRDRELDAEARRQIQVEQMNMSIGETNRHNEVTERNNLYVAFQRHTETQRTNQAREAEERRYHDAQKADQTRLTDARVDDITDQEYDRRLRRGDQAQLVKNRVDDIFDQQYDRRLRRESQLRLELAKIKEIEEKQKGIDRHNKVMERIARRQRGRGGLLGCIGTLVPIVICIAILFFIFTLCIAMIH